MEGKLLANHLQGTGVLKDPLLISAFKAISRADFVRPEDKPYAYIDEPRQIGFGQTISQPSVVGVMTQALAPTPRCKVLEVGAGSGYQTAILARLARRVYAIERHKPLAREAARRCAALDLANVSIIAGDGALGWPDQAPFDRIMLTAAAEDPPALLLKQLREGGVMVLPVGQSDDVQQLLRIVKTPQGLRYDELMPVRFVPLIEGVPEAE